MIPVAYVIDVDALFVQLLKSSVSFTTCINYIGHMPSHDRMIINDECVEGNGRGIF
jgi:hypothetical protein